LSHSPVILLFSAFDKIVSRRCLSVLQLKYVWNAVNCFMFVHFLSFAVHFSNIIEVSEVKMHICFLLLFIEHAQSLENWARLGIPDSQVQLDVPSQS
jgi:hypothetical protein